MGYTVIAISVGGSIGALLRWFLGVKLNALYPSLPLGTLGSNWLGGYLIGLAMAFFATHSALSSEWRLLIITGFLGGLTTFSTFSAEMVSLIHAGKFGVMALGMALHVGGSIVMTLFGIASYKYMWGG